MNNQKNMNMSIGRMIVMIMLLMIVVVGGTFAWFTFSSKQSALVLTIGNINNTQITLTPYQVKEDAMTPVNTYTSGVSSDVIIKNNEKNNSVALYYKINQLDENLINNGLKYTIVDTKTNQTVKTGDFIAYIGKKEALIYENNDIATNSELNYRVYLWVDSSVGNQNNIVDSKIDIELNGAIGSVEITGNNQNIYGGTLVANITDFDSHITSDDGLSNSTTDYEIQWYVSSNENMTGSTAEKICNATSRSYTIGSDLGTGTGCIDGSKAIFAGKYIYVLVTVRKEDGAYTKTYKDLADSDPNDGDASNGSDTVLAKPITVTAGSGPSDRQYNGTELKVNTCSASGVLSGHQTTCTMTEASTIINVGTQTNVIDTVSIKYNSSDVTANYDITTKTGTLTVTPKELTLSWGPEDENTKKIEFEYNGETQSPTVIVNTGVSGETQSPTVIVNTGVSGETMTISKTGGVDAGDYTSTASCASVTGGQGLCSNYTLTNNTKEFTITPRKVEVIWEDKTEFEYDGTSHIPAVTNPIDGVSGEKINLTVSGSSSEIGSHTATASCASMTPSTKKCSNYTITNPTKSFSIYKTLTAEFSYRAGTDTFSNEVRECKLVNQGQTSCTVTTPSALGTPSGYSFRGWSISMKANALIGQLATTTEVSVHGALPETTIELNKTIQYYASYQREATSTFVYSTLSAEDEVYSGHTGATVTATGVEYMDYKGLIFEAASKIDIPSVVLNSTGGAGASQYDGLVKYIDAVNGITIDSNATKVAVGNDVYYAKYSEPVVFYYYVDDYPQYVETERVMKKGYNGYEITILNEPVLNPLSYSLEFNNISPSGWSSNNNSVNHVEPLITGYSDYFAYYQGDVTINYSCDFDVSNCPDSHDVTVLYITVSSVDTNNATLSSIIPTKTNYTFIGWYKSGCGSYQPGSIYDGGCVSKTEDGTYSVTFTADFRGNPYTVSYYFGKDLIGTSNHIYGDDASLNSFSDFTLNTDQRMFLNQISDYGWEFTGWGLGADSTVLEYFDNVTISPGNQLIYAIFSRTISFYSGINGTLTGEKPQFYNPYNEDPMFLYLNGILSSVEIVVPQAIDNFEVWGYTHSNGGAPSYDSNGITPSLTSFPELYAWYISDKKVNFKSGAGNLITTRSMICSATYMSYESFPTTCVVNVPSKNQTAVLGPVDTAWEASGYRSQNDSSHVKTYDFESLISLSLDDNIEFYAVYSRMLTFDYSVEAAGSGGTILPGETTGAVKPNLPVDRGISFSEQKFDSGTDSTNNVNFPILPVYYEYTVKGWTDDSDSTDLTWIVNAVVPVNTKAIFYDVRYKDVNAYYEPSRSHSLRIYVVNEMIKSYQLPSSCSDAYSDFGWECAGWMGSSSASSPSYSLGKTMNGPVGNLYAIYSRTITAYSGKDDNLTTHKATQYMNASANNVSTLTFPTTSNRYSFDSVASERGDDFTLSGFGFACEFCEASQYAPSYNTVPVNPNAIYKRDATLSQLGGWVTNESSMIEQRPGYYTQYYSSAGNYKLDMTFTASIYGYSVLGYVDSDDDEFAYGITRVNGDSFSYTGSSNTLYAVYTKEVECVSGYSDSTVIDDATIYFSASYRLAASFPRKSNLDDWTFRGWRSDTTAADREYGGATTTIISGVPDKFYAVYSRNKNFTYYANGGIDRLPDPNPRTKVVYMNTSSLTTSDQSLIVSSKFPFKEGGYAFRGWNNWPSASSAAYIPGQKYDFYTDAKVLTSSGNWNESFYAIYGLVSQGYATVTIK